MIGELNTVEVAVDAERLHRDLTLLLCALQERVGKSLGTAPAAAKEVLDASVQVSADLYTDEVCLQVDLRPYPGAVEQVQEILSAPHGYAAAADLELSLAVRLLAANAGSIELNEHSLTLGLPNP